MDLVIRLGKVASEEPGGGDALGALGTVDKVCARWRGAKGGLPFVFRETDEGITGRADEGGGLVGGGGGGKAGGR